MHFLILNFAVSLSTFYLVSLTTFFISNYWCQEKAQMNTSKLFSVMLIVFEPLIPVFWEIIIYFFDFCLFKVLFFSLMTF